LLHIVPPDPEVPRSSEFCDLVEFDDRREAEGDSGLSTFIIGRWGGYRLNEFLLSEHQCRPRLLRPKAEAVRMNLKSLAKVFSSSPGGETTRRSRRLKYDCIIGETGARARFSHRIGDARKH
jgi:hypothetical protein